MIRLYLQHRRPGFDPWVEKIPWRWEWLPTPVFLPRKIHGQRSLVGYSPWGHKKSLTLSLHFSFMVILCLTFLKTTKLFTKVAIPFWAAPGLWLLSMLIILMGMQYYFIMVSIIKDVFSCLFAVLRSSHIPYGEVCSNLLPIFLNVWVNVAKFWEFLIYLKYKHFFLVMCSNMELAFYSLNRVLRKAKVFTFD